MATASEGWKVGQEKNKQIEEDKVSREEHH